VPSSSRPDRATRAAHERREAGRAPISEPVIFKATDHNDKVYPPQFSSKVSSELAENSQFAGCYHTHAQSSA